LLSVAVAAAASIFTSGAFAQDTDTGVDTAYVPFLVNVDAAVKAEPADGAVFDAPVQISVKGGAESFIRIPLQKTIGVLYGTQKQTNRSAVVSNCGGKVTLNLPAQSYKNAVVARNYQGNFNAVGISGHWWTSTEYLTGVSSFAYFRSMFYDYDNVSDSNNYKTSGYSLRC
jgi:hypothetical protein